VYAFPLSQYSGRDVLWVVKGCFDIFGDMLFTSKVKD
jgi:hypothetical protein